MTAITLNLVPVLVVLQQHSGELLKTCMKIAALQWKRIFLSEAFVINGTTQKLKELSVT